jgi:hypothetical protein
MREILNYDDNLRFARQSFGRTQTPHGDGSDGLVTAFLVFIPYLPYLVQAL